MRPDTRHYLELVDAAIDRAHLHAVESLHAACREAGVSIFQWTKPLSPEARKRITTGFTLIASADSLESVQRVYANHMRIYS